MPEVELMNFDQKNSYALGMCMLKSNFETFPKEAAKWRKKGLAFGWNQNDNVSTYYICVFGGT